MLKLFHDEPEEQKLWESLASNECPNCKTTRQLAVTAEGGIAFNVQCLECHALFWMTPMREFGAKRLNKSSATH